MAARRADKAEILGMAPSLHRRTLNLGASAPGAQSWPRRLLDRSARDPRSRTGRDRAEPVRAAIPEVPLAKVTHPYMEISPGAGGYGGFMGGGARHAGSRGHVPAASGEGDELTCQCRLRDLLQHGIRTVR